MGRFERIASQRIYQQIVEQISQMVRDGSLSPGDRLPPERQLAEEFGVSRAAVREALSALRLMGLVEVRPGEGTYVRSGSTEGLVSPLALFLAVENQQAVGLELLELREALESEAAYLAAQRYEAEDVAAMDEALRVMGEDLSTGETGAEADFRFHNAIAAAAGNGLLLKTMGSLADVMKEELGSYRERLLRIPTMGQTLLEDHRSILEAIRERHPALAHERMRSHIRRVRVTLYGGDPAPLGQGER